MNERSTYVLSCRYLGGRIQIDFRKDDSAFKIKYIHTYTPRRARGPSNPVVPAYPP